MFEALQKYALDYGLINMGETAGFHHMSIICQNNDLLSEAGVVDPNIARNIPAENNEVTTKFYHDHKESARFASYTATCSVALLGGNAEGYSICSAEEIILYETATVHIASIYMAYGVTVQYGAAELAKLEHRLDGWHLTAKSMMSFGYVFWKWNEQTLRKWRSSGKNRDDARKSPRVYPIGMAGVRESNWYIS
jgi:hypothetical protein